MSALFKKNNFISYLNKLFFYISKAYLIYRLRSLLWFFIKLRKNVLNYQYGNRFKIKLYTSSKLSKLIYCGQFEKDEFGYIDKYINKDSVIFDIGANIGLHSLYFSCVIGSDGFCYSFEPVKSTYDRLNENIEFNVFKNIKAFNIAFSNSDQTLDIYRSKNGYDAWNSLAGFQNISDNKFEISKVECKKLDDFLDSNPSIRPPDFIKIDTEGWELNVLKGAQNYLTNNSPVLMIEYSQKNLKMANTEQSELFDYLTSLGYQLFQYNHKKDYFLPISRNDVYDYINVIAKK
jgi:FkbM family methyltransferase